MPNEPQSPQIQNILAAIDGSEHSEKAGFFAVDLAIRYGARVILLHVANYPIQYLGLTDHDVAVGLPLPNDQLESMKKKARDSIDRIGTFAHKQNVAISQDTIQTESSIAESISEYAEKKSVQIIVVGIRGLGNFDPYVVGSVASGLVSRARCSLLIVR